MREPSTEDVRPYQVFLPFRTEADAAVLGSTMWDA
jgi:hypothetical protein